MGNAVLLALGVIHQTPAQSLRSAPPVVTSPAADRVALLRFEGVPEGIVPVNAIVEGLPGGTVEKNRDARLLSPASLVDGALGRGVTLTRTDRAPGQRREEEATKDRVDCLPGDNDIPAGGNPRFSGCAR